MRTRGLLTSDPDFARYWWGQALSAFGTSMSSIALPLVILHLTGSVVSAGAVATVRLLVLNLARLPGGVLADRWSRRNAMVVTDLTKAVLWAVPALVVASGTDHPLWPVLIVAVGDGLVSSVYNPSLGAVLRLLVPPTQIMRAVSLNEARTYAASLAGPAAGGALFALAPAAPFLVDSVTFVVCAALAAMIRTDLGGRNRADRGMAAEIGHGLAYLARQPFLRLLVLWSALLNFATAAAFFGLIPVARDAGLPASRIGLLSALVSAGALAGALLAPRLAGHRPFGLLIGAGVTAVVLTGAVAVSPRLAVIACGLIVLSALGPLLVVVMTSQVYAIVPDELMARTQSSMLLLGSALYPFATLTMGLLLAHAGTGPAYGTLAACLAVCAAICLAAPIRRQLTRQSRTAPAHRPNDPGVEAPRDRAESVSAPAA